MFQKQELSEQSHMPLIGAFSNENEGLIQIVEDIVMQLNCVAAISTVVENSKRLSVRAYAANLTESQISRWATHVDLFSLQASPVISLDERKYKNNFAVRAVKLANGRSVITTTSLYDVMRPYMSSRAAQKMQADLNIRQVVAVPCLLRNEVIGHLIAATTSQFSQRDIDFLKTFGHQAAATIQSQRRLDAMQALERVVLSLQATMTNEEETLQTVVDAVVNQLGFAGAMVATLEAGNSLPVRAYSFDVAPNIIRQLEDKAGVRLIGPSAMVHLDNPKYKDNLSVRAIRRVQGGTEKFLESDRLYDLFRPIAGKTFSDVTQTLMGVKRVIAVPFFLENEVVGNLFVMTRRPTFTSWETTILTAFGQQAAVGIRNARYYREAQEQRQIATMFARMAFSATTSVHALRNHIGAAHTHLNLFAMMADDSPDQAARLLARTPAIVGRLDKAADLLDKLHEPWRQEPDRSVSVNDCIIRALRDVFPEVRTRLGKEQVVNVSGIAIHLSLTTPEPMIVTSADMLAEAFRIVLKNGAEALLESKNERKLWLRTAWSGRDQLKVFIQDSGTGIKETHLTKIFDMGWSTKEGQGMGFGLFWTKDYVNGMGGEIRVESVWQQGTSFCIELPVRQTSS